MSVALEGEERGLCCVQPYALLEQLCGGSEAQQLISVIASADGHSQSRLSLDDDGSLYSGLQLTMKSAHSCHTVQINFAEPLPNGFTMLQSPFLIQRFHSL